MAESQETSTFCTAGRQQTLPTTQQHNLDRVTRVHNPSLSRPIFISKLRVLLVLIFCVTSNKECCSDQSTVATVPTKLYSQSKHQHPFLALERNEEDQSNILLRQSIVSFFALHYRIVHVPFVNYLNRDSCVKRFLELGMKS